MDFHDFVDVLWWTTLALVVIAIAINQWAAHF